MKLQSRRYWINLKKIIKNTPKDDAAKVEENGKIIDTVERILELDNKIQSGEGLKVLTPNEMLSRLAHEIFTKTNFF